MPNPPITKIMDQLYLGDAVVSLSLGPWVHWHQPWYKEIIIEGNHHFRRCADSMTQDMLPMLAEICEFIKDHLTSGSVLVHCDRGVSRSVTAMIAYLMQTYQYDVVTALAFVKEKRKVRPNENFKEQLEVWGAVGGKIWTAEGLPKPEYAAFWRRGQ